MRFFKLLAHLFIPHESNNQKAKILHPEGLLFLAVFLASFQVLLNFSSKTFPQVLGYAANISPNEVIRLTNIQRAANGLGAVSENSTLDAAALAKGNDMLAKGYWAHFAPDGTSPWSFFLKFGYKYSYAGENLARDFSDASSAVAAWMNSPSHKENILNSHYKEIGIGVVEGRLGGADTTIIVQFFGTPLKSVAAIPAVQAKEIVPILEPIPQAQTTVATPLISPFQSSKSLSLGILGILLLVLCVDLIIVRRRRISRIGGRTLAHIAFLGMILAVILILKAGQII